MKIYVNGIDVTKYCGNITLASSLDTLGDQLDFEIAYNTSKESNAINVNVGDKVVLTDAEEVFRGIVVAKTRDVHSNQFSCFDYAFYLNKSKVIKQFNKVRIDEAIKQLLNEFSVPVGSIANLPIITNKIFFDKTVSDIVSELLEDATSATGKKYVKEMNKGRFEIYEDRQLVIDCKVKLAENLGGIDINRTISNPSKTASIEETKNSIKVYISNDDSVTEYAEAKSQTMISKYGLLQETISIEDGDKAKAKNIAETVLKEKGRVAVKGNIEVIGSFDLRAGRILRLNEPNTNLVGNYKITSVNHSIGSMHTASLELEEV